MGEDRSFLEKVVADKKKEVEELKERIKEDRLRQEVSEGEKRRSFSGALQAGNGPRIIGELKRSSPSRGLIRDPFSPAHLAGELEAGGAVALSVLTEEPNFGGSLQFLREARKASGLPLLRKDFIVDPYQVVESRAWGADALLLIVAALDRDRLEELIRETHRMEMDCLVEVHSRDELDVALEAGATLVGINNRNLKTLEVEIGLTRELAPLVPEGVLTVAESGIRTREDISSLLPFGVDAFLIGEVLMASEHPGRKLRELLGV